MANIASYYDFLFTWIIMGWNAIFKGGIGLQTGMQHAHVDSWWLLIVLFLITYFLLRAGVNKGAKILHMIVRLFYIVMIFSGIYLLFMWGFPLTHVLKGVLAIVLIYAMEMILVRTKKGTLGSKAPMYWGILVASLVIVLLLAFRILTF